MNKSFKTYLLAGIIGLTGIQSVSNAAPFAIDYATNKAFTALSGNRPDAPACAAMLALPVVYGISGWVNRAYINAKYSKNKCATKIKIWKACKDFIECIVAPTTTAVSIAVAGYQALKFGIIYDAITRDIGNLEKYSCSHTA